MGPAVTPVGVFMRKGSIIATSERVVQRLDLVDFISDNTGSFSEQAFPRNG
jgi:hypothetical protein